MGALQRRAGAQKHPLRTRRRSLQRRRVKAVLSDYQERAATDHEQRNSDVEEDEEAVLARLMPSTWRSKSVCDAAAGEELAADADVNDRSSPDPRAHTFWKSLQGHFEAGVKVVDYTKLAPAPEDHPLRPSKHFLVVLTRRLFPRKVPIPVTPTEPLPELRWSAATGSGQSPPSQPVSDGQPSLGYSGSESLHSQKVRHRDFQPAAMPASRSKATFRRVEAGSASPRSQYAAIQPTASPEATGATAHIDATLKLNLASLGTPAKEDDLASSISNVLDTLAPAAPDSAARQPPVVPIDPWHQPAAAQVQTVSARSVVPSADSGEDACPAPAAPAAPKPAASASASRSAVETLPCPSIDEIPSGVGAVDTLRTRLHRPAEPFPPQYEIDDTPPIPGMRPRSQLIYDEGKEAHRSWRRYVYDFDYWANDRSAARFFFAMLHLPATRILRDVLGPTLLVAAIAAVRCTPSASAAVAAAAEQLAGLLPAAIRSFGGALTSVVSGTPTELTAGFVGLLVSFRANNAATRFDEARKQLATMLNATRDSVRLAIATLPAGAVQAKASFARWVIVAFASLQCQLRIDDDLEKEVEGLLTDAEQQLLFSSDHPTLMCFAVLARMIENTKIQDPQKRLMQRSVTRMVDVLGGCERIMDTPIPVATMRHSARALMIWLAMFPICMYPALGAHVLWVAPFAAFLLFGMEEISVEIEEPFSMLPIEVITAKARSDIITLVNNQSACDCATDTVVGNAMTGAPMRLNSMERPTETTPEEPSGWLKPSWAAID